MFIRNLIIIIVFIFSFFQKSVLSFENKILFKIDNEIITTIDILNEINFLTLMNKNVDKISKDEKYQLSTNSLIKEKIKKIEILKNYESIQVDPTHIDKIVKSTYERLGFDNMNSFKNYLIKNNINIETIEEKIAIDALWNEIIFFKFSKKVKIDKQRLKEKINKRKEKMIKSYLLSEIVFNVEKKKNFISKYESIKNDIKQKGFESSALLHSISSTSDNGGKLGWINENSLSSKLLQEISKLSKDEFTKPIVIPGGFLILKLNELKIVNNEINLEEELKKQITSLTNKQLNQFSNIYFNKVKKEIQINEI
tara:strand:- start:2544 stop:3476 length:933 start_codon:yes stop_codon:yes gene_type:complete